MKSVLHAAKIAISFVSVGAAIAGVIALVRGRWLWCIGFLAVAVAADLLTRWWSRRAPIPMPAYVAWVLFLPRGQSAAKLIRNLQPRPGETILEIGPGVGIHSIPVAEALKPGGVLHAIDVQQKMLDRLRERAVRRGTDNIVAKHADACQLPYADEMFDAAYLLSVLGEIGDAPRMLREVHRVLKRDARLVIGEAIIDPDFIPLGELKAAVEAAGFALQRTEGSRLSYMATFRSSAL